MAVPHVHAHLLPLYKYGAIHSILWLELLYKRVGTADVPGLRRKCHTLRGKKQEGPKQTALLDSGWPAVLQAGSGISAGLGRGLGARQGRGQPPVYSEKFAIKRQQVSYSALGGDPALWNSPL